MRCMREHINRLNSNYFVLTIQQSQVACLGRWIATDVYNAFRMCPKDDINNVRMHAGTWWVSDDNIRTTVLLDEAFGQNVLHVTCVKECVTDLVYLRINLSILNCFRYILNTNDLTGVFSNEVGYCSCASI